MLKIEIDTNHFPSAPVELVEGQIKDAANTITPINEQKFVFVFQTVCQQRLLKLYGKQAILTEMNKKFTHIPFPW